MLNTSAPAVATVTALAVASIFFTPTRVPSTGAGGRVTVNPADVALQGTRSLAAALYVVVFTPVGISSSESIVSVTVSKSVAASESPVIQVSFSVARVNVIV